MLTSVFLKFLIDNFFKFVPVKASTKLVWPEGISFSDKCCTIPYFLERENMICGSSVSFASNPPCNHQKTYNFLMISGGIEVNESYWKLSFDFPNLFLMLLAVITFKDFKKSFRNNFHPASSWKIWQVNLRSIYLEMVEKQIRHHSQISSCLE